MPSVDDLADQVLEVLNYFGYYTDSLDCIILVATVTNAFY